MAATDADYHDFMQRGQTDIGEVHDFHICGVPEGRKFGNGNFVHMTRFSMLKREQAASLLYAQSAVEEYLDALDEVSEAPEALADSSGPKRRVSWKASETVHSSKFARTSGGADADDGRHQAMGAAAKKKDQFAVDRALAQQLADADAQVASAAKG